MRASVKQQMYNIIEMYDSEFGRANIVISPLCVRSRFSSWKYSFGIPIENRDAF